MHNTPKRRNSKTEHPNSPANRSFSKWLTFLLVAIGVFMSTLDGSIVNITLPVIMKELEMSLTSIEWVVMIYLFTVSVLLLSFGRLSDILGRRRIYVCGLLTFSAGSFLCGIAQSGIMLILSRAFQGVGASMIMACTPALIIDTFPLSEKGKAMGMVGAIVSLGLTAGPVLGGLIVYYFSWRLIFIINIPIGIITAIAVNKTLKGGKTDISRAESFDRVGALLIALCLGPFLLAVTHGNSWGYMSPPVLSLICISVISGTLFIIIENRITHPIIETSLFAIRLFTLPLLAAITLFAGLFSLVFLMPFYLMYPCGFSVDQAGYIMVTLFMFLFVISPLSGVVSDKLGSRWLCTFGMGLLAFSLFSISQCPPSASPFPIIWRLALAGIGTALFLPPNSSVTMGAVPPEYRGVAAGTVAMVRNIGMVAGIAIAGTIFNSVFSELSGGLSLKGYCPDLEAVFMAAFSRAMLSAMIIAGIGMVLAFLRGSNK